MPSCTGFCRAALTRSTRRAASALSGTHAWAKAEIADPARIGAAALRRTHAYAKAKMPRRRTGLRAAAARGLAVVASARAQFQFEIPQGMLSRCTAWAAAAAARRAATSAPSGIHDNFDWLKATSWHWNASARRALRRDGRFEARRRTASRASASSEAARRATIYIRRGQAGLHALRPTKMEAAADTRLKGKRVQDGGGARRRS